MYASACAIHVFACAGMNDVEQFSSACKRLGYTPLISHLPEVLDYDSADGLSILLAGGQSSAEFRAQAEQLAGYVDLLVACDTAALECTELLTRCAGVLVAPYDDNALLAHLAGAQQRKGEDCEISEALELNMVGRSPSMRRMMRQVSVFAKYSTPVLLTGETGTGKELVARGIHYSSERCDKSFVPVNCCAFNDELLLGELFGYEKGAFTDAKRSHRGLVAQAEGGTLFLDEVDSLSPKGQGALLRFLQDHEYRPVGGTELIRSDVRVISATNKDISQLVEKGLFREDLYYRLHVLHVTIPALREREGDIILLAEHYLGQFSRKYKTPNKVLHPLTLRWMEQYAWPGNVRELENYLHRIFVLSRGVTIFVPTKKGDPFDTFGEVVEQATDSDIVYAGESFREARDKMLQDFERNYLRDVMRATAGNVSEAARRTGKERRTFARLLKKHGISRELFLKD